MKITNKLLFNWNSCEDLKILFSEYHYLAKLFSVITRSRVLYLGSNLISGLYDHTLINSLSLSCKNWIRFMRLLCETRLIPRYPSFVKYKKEILGMKTKTVYTIDLFPSSYIEQLFIKDSKFRHHKVIFHY